MGDARPPVDCTPLLRGLQSAAVPPAPLPRRQIVICVGCIDDSTLLDRVLGPASTTSRFSNPADGSLQLHCTARPNKVIFCMRADDEKSLQVLPMLNLDPRTNRIPILTCVPSITGGIETGESIGPANSRRSIRAR
jgi:hypothetical protein